MILNVSQENRNLLLKSIPNIGIVSENQTIQMYIQGNLISLISPNNFNLEAGFAVRVTDVLRNRTHNFKFDKEEVQESNVEPLPPSFIFEEYIMRLMEVLISGKEDITFKMLYQGMLSMNIKTNSKYKWERNYLTRGLTFTKPLEDGSDGDELITFEEFCSQLYNSLPPGRSLTMNCS